MCLTGNKSRRCSAFIRCDALTVGFTALEKEVNQCKATRLINPEVQIHRKSCVGLMVLTSIEKLPSIEPSDVNSWIECAASSGGLVL